MKKTNFLCKAIHFITGFSYRSLLKIAQNPEKTNQKLISDILKRNAFTEIGRKYKFSQIKSIEEYQTKVPLSTYDDYETAVQRMTMGEKNILTKDTIKAYGQTSGTTGKSKIIPISNKAMTSMVKRMIPLAYILADRFPAIFKKGKSINLSNNANTSTTQDGTFIGAATSIGSQHTKLLQSKMNTSPTEISQIADHQKALYLHILFALKEKKVKAITGFFSSSVFDFFLTLENNWEQLIKDLKTRKINQNLDLEPILRQKLEKQLKASEERINELENEFQKGMDNIASRIWPDLVCVISTISGPFKIYGNRLKKYISNLPIYSPMYGATEGISGINIHPENDYYTLVPGALFFEFLPINQQNDGNPQTLQIHQLTPGEDYEVILTNYSGFYRYRLGDIVRVVKYFYKLPVIEFIRRKGNLLNIAAEKTSEQAVLWAIENWLKQSEIEIIDFTTKPCIDSAPGYYQFFIEFKNQSTNVDELKQLSIELDRSLAESNPRYAVARDHHKLGCLQILSLKKGSFSKFKNHKIERGASPNQVKIPRILNSEENLTFFTNQIKPSTKEPITL